MIADSVAFLTGQGKRVIYDAEHFFDALPRRLRLCAPLPAGGGGGRCRERDALRHERLVAAVAGRGGHRARRGGARRGRRRSGIHTHDDAGCGVANTLMAVEAGARHGAGHDERLRRALRQRNLITILPALELKMGYESIGRERLRRLTETAHLVDELCNVTPNPNQPYVGANAFAHKGGMHVAGVNRDARTFEHIDPTEVGADRRRARLRAVRQGHRAGAARTWTTARPRAWSSA